MQLIDVEHARSESSALKMHDHPCSIYETSEELISQFVPYMQAGLLSGEKAVYFIDENDRHFVEAAMSANNFDVQSYIASGAFEIIKTTDAHLEGGFFSEEKMLAYWNGTISAAINAGYSGVRAAVEMTWALRGKPGCEQLVAYESKLNLFTSANKLTVICMYHNSKFPADIIEGIIHGHPLIAYGAEVLDNCAYVEPDKFEAGSARMNVKALLDHMVLTKQLEEANRALQAANEELQSLAYTVSHELQEPLIKFQSYQNLLAVRYQHKLGEDAQRFIHECKQSAEIIQRMIDDLWDYARISSSKQQFAFLPIQMPDLFSTTVANMNGVMHGAHVEFDFPNQMPNARGVEQHLTRLIEEILRNAVRHNKSTRAKIFVKGYVSQPGYLECSVQDNGVGINPLEEVEAFKLFNRLGKRPGPDGTGMGLAIALKVIEMHSGEIWIEAHPDGGSVVKFTLPTS